jgi:hypothetical protein
MAGKVQGFGTALMANAQLMGYFLDKGESSAAVIQGIGVVSNYAVLFQMVWAGHLPHTFAQMLSVAATATAAMVAARLLLQQSAVTENAWHAWQALLAVIGLVTVPQVLAGTFFGTQSLWPAYIAAVPGAQTWLHLTSSRMQVLPKTMTRDTEAALLTRPQASAMPTFCILTRVDRCDSGDRVQLRRC